MGVSAVLITREKEYPQDIKLDFPFDEVIIETECPGIRRRFELSLEAKNDIIYVQDDDCEIDIQALWKLYDGRLTNAITDYHHRSYAPTGMSLVGWGCFFPKTLIDWTRWTQKYGDTWFLEVDGAMHHVADRVFTYLAQPHNSIVMPIRQIKRPGVRLCNLPGHYKARDLCLKMLRAL